MSSEASPLLKERLKRADEELRAIAPSGDMRRRWEHRIGDRARRRGSPRPVLALLAAPLALATCFLLSPASQTEAITKAKSEANPRKPAPLPSAPVRLAASEDMAFHAWGLRVEALRATHLVGTREGFRLIEGFARFSVTSRPADRPLRIQTQSAVIEVIGTRFVVDSGPSGGFVDLEEGQIALYVDGSQPRRIAPGEIAGWGDRARVWSKAEVEAEAERIVALGRQRGPLAAQRAWMALLRQPIDRHAAEVASFELSRILDEVGEGCEHWDRHEARFPQGRLRDLALNRNQACREGNSSMGSE